MYIYMFPVYTIKIYTICVNQIELTTTDCSHWYMYVVPNSVTLFTEAKCSQY